MGWFGGFKSQAMFERIPFLVLCFLSAFVPVVNTLTRQEYLLVKEAMEEFEGADMSVLSQLRKSHIRMQPYPHLVISPALPLKLYRALDLAFPSTEEVLSAARAGKLLKGKPAPNTRHKIQAPQALNRKPGARKLHEIWRRFTEYHTSPAFYKEMVTHFGKQMEESHGYVLPNSTKFRGFGIRGLPEGKPRPTIMMDCQISINTPPPRSGRKTTVRGAHLDSPIEIYAGLLYMRDPKDTCTGGDLEVIKCVKPGGKCKRLSDTAMAAMERKGQAGLQYPPGDLKAVDVVPYAPNTLVFFINTRDAFHAVTPRTGTHLPRRFVNIVAQENYVYTDPPPKKCALCAGTMRQQQLQVAPPDAEEVEPEDRSDSDKTQQATGAGLSDAVTRNPLYTST